jgi:hypothetical protein
MQTKKEPQRICARCGGVLGDGRFPSHTICLRCAGFMRRRWQPQKQERKAS